MRPCSTSHYCSTRSKVEAVGLLEFCWSLSLQNASAELLVKFHPRRGFSSQGVSAPAILLSCS